MTWFDETTAVFGRMTVHVSDTLRYTLGARYTSMTKEADLYARTMLPGTVSPQVAAAFGMPIAGLPRQAVFEDLWPFNSFLQKVDDKFSRDDNSTTWSASIQKDLSENIMMYASAATGFKAGGYNSTSGEDDMQRGFDKTETTNLEIGIKSRPRFDTNFKISCFCFIKTSLHIIFT